MTPSASDDLLQALVALLDLEEVDTDAYRGGSIDIGGRSVYGGQVVAQALAAAVRTVDSAREPHSLHAYFLLPGDVAKPILFQVDRIRDGRSFTARRVQALQNGRAILSMIASFQLPEEGVEHADPMPEVPPPEALQPVSQLLEGWLDEAGVLDPRLRPLIARAMNSTAIEFRAVTPHNPLRPCTAPAQQALWFRIQGALPDSPMLHRLLMTYASDFNLLSTAMRPHGRTMLSPELMMASLDHALWFHRAARVDQWLLYGMNSPAAQSARGLSRGCIWDRQGRLVATVAQEGLMRVLSSDRQWRRSAAHGR